MRAVWSAQAHGSTNTASASQPACVQTEASGRPGAPTWMAAQSPSLMWPWGERRLADRRYLSRLRALSFRSACGSTGSAAVQARGCEASPALQIGLRLAVRPACQQLATHREATEERRCSWASWQASEGIPTHRGSAPQAVASLQGGVQLTQAAVDLRRAGGREAGRNNWMGI